MQNVDDWEQLQDGFGYYTDDCQLPEVGQVKGLGVQVPEICFNNYIEC